MLGPGNVQQNWKKRKNVEVEKGKEEAEEEEEKEEEKKE